MTKNSKPGPIRKLGWGLACIVAVLAHLGCGETNNSGSEEVVKIGSILDMTGVGASYGKRMKQGFELAIEDHEARLPGGKDFKLVVEDFQWDTAKALTVYRKLTDVDGIKVIVGITGSNNAKPVAEASRTDDVVIVDALTSSPTLTVLGGPNYFRVMASDALAGRFNADWAASEGMSRAAIVYAEDEWGVSYKDELKGHIDGYDSVEILELGAPEASRDYRTQIARLSRFRPDALFLLLYPPDGGVFMQQARQAGVDTIVYGSDNLSAPEFTAPGPSVVEGVRLALPAAVDGPAYEDFERRFFRKFGEKADTLAAKSYDAMAVALDAIERAGADPPAIRSLFGSEDYVVEGLSGPIRFDENGDISSQEYTRMHYVDGALVPFRGREWE